MRQLVDDIIARHPVKAGSFIVTLYGDVVAPRGGTVWTGNVVDACGLAGISETHVRTAVSRLVARDRLTGERQGRRSFYRLADAARREFDQAAAVIYGGHATRTANAWTFVSLQSVSDAAASMAVLQRYGFARLSANMAIAANECSLRAAPFLDTLRAEGALVFTALLEPPAGQALRDFASSLWPIEEQQSAYLKFITTFAPLRQAAALSLPDGETCLLARLILVHIFRELALADPALPHDALPAGWAGVDARRLFASLYRAFSGPADRYIAATFTDENGPLAETNPSVRERLKTLQKF